MSDLPSGKFLQEALHFLEQLTACMGQNTEFSIDHICEGVDQTAVVNWHLGNSIHSSDISNKDKKTKMQSDLIARKDLSLGFTVVNSMIIIQCYNFNCRMEEEASSFH